MQVSRIETKQQYINKLTKSKVIYKQGLQEHKFTDTSNLNNNPTSCFNKININFEAIKKIQVNRIEQNLINELAETSNFNATGIKTLDELLHKKIINDMFKNTLKTLAYDRDCKTRHLEDWIDYLSKEENGYAFSTQLFILKSMIKNIDENKGFLPVINRKAIEDTMNEIARKLQRGCSNIPDFKEMYEKKLDGWIVIPSKEHDAEHFKENAKILESLSHYNDKYSFLFHDYMQIPEESDALKWLARGDFHVYIENGKPEIGLKFNGDSITRIMAKRFWDNDLFIEHINLIQSYVENNGYKYSTANEKLMKKPEIAKERMNRIKIHLAKEIENKEYAKILSYLGYEPQTDKKGFLKIKYYGQPDKYYTFEDLGIDENDMFQYIISAETDVTLWKSKLTSLQNLKYIGEDFYPYKLNNLGELQFVGNCMECGDNLKSLGKIKSIKGYLFCGENLQDLGELESVGLELYCNDKLKSLCNVKTIGDTLYCGEKLEDFGELQTVGKSVCCGPNVTSLNKLERIGDMLFCGESLNDLGKLKYVGRGIEFKNCRFKTHEMPNGKPEQVYYEGHLGKIYNLKAVEIKNGCFIRVNPELNKPENK